MSKWLTVVAGLAAALVEAGSALAQTRYEGRIEGDTITGTARTNNQQQARPWRATRVAGRTDIEVVTP